MVLLFEEVPGTSKVFSAHWSIYTVVSYSAGKKVTASTVNLKQLNLTLPSLWRTHHCSIIWLMPWTKKNMKGKVLQPTSNWEAFSSSTRIASSGWGTVKAGTPCWIGRKRNMDTEIEVTVSCQTYFPPSYALRKCSFNENLEDSSLLPSNCSQSISYL